MLRPLHRTASAAAALSFLSLPTAAEPPVELAAVVVTATRQPTRADRVLADVTVLDRDEIAAAGWSSVPEMLAAQPGVEYSSTGGTGQPASLFLRGANGGHTLVLLDGMRLNSATLGTASLEAIPLSAIERVEILRGPASSLYGADAIGGVVQLFTRRVDGPPRLQAAVAAGNYGASRGEFALGGNEGPWSFTLAGGRERTRSVSAIRHPDDRWASVFFTTDPYNPDADGNRNDSFTGQLRFRPAPGHEVGLQASRFAATTHKDATQCDPVFFFPCTAAYDSRTTQKISGTSAFWTGKLHQAWTTTVRVEESEDRMRDYRLDPTRGVEFHNRFTTRQRQLVWQNDLAVGPGTALLALERLDQDIDADRSYTARSRSIRAWVAGYDLWAGPHGLQASLRNDS
ncbi:MAG: TonB-dependent receptor, partial [Rhodocyclaceae bacterium]|nr:TonB-dependent receptor [Rhodocyclaceae bacterium]